MSTIANVVAIPATLATSVLILLLFGAVIVILFYIFKSIGIYRMAKNKGVKAPGLAWLPIFDWLILGRTADHIRKEEGASHSGFGGWIFLLTIVIIVGDIAQINILGNITIANFSESFSKAALNIIWFLPVMALCALCTIAVLVLKLIVLFYVYKECSSAYGALFIISFFFSFLIPVFLFAIRKNAKQKEEPYETVDGV